jgi:hypothetical protein
MQRLGLIVCVALLSLGLVEPAIAGALGTWSGLVAETSVATLEDRVETVVFFSTFSVGIITDAQAYSDFGDAAGNDFPREADVDWQSDLVVYAILEENTNRLAFESWQPPIDGTGTLLIDWSLIEPYYHEAYPALFHTVSREDLAAIDVLVKYETESIPLANLLVASSCTTLLGDVNQDGQVDGLDVDPFVGVLLDGGYQTEADMNKDQVVDGVDVDPFVAAVVGGGTQQIPEPSALVLATLGLLSLLAHARRRIAA